VGTFGLVVFATIEVLMFSWIFGLHRGWDEMHRGADLRVAPVFKQIMKWVTPAFLLILLGWWSVTQALPTLLMENVADRETIPVRWFSRAVILLMLAAGLLMIRKAWKRQEGSVSAGPEQGPKR
jgi:hypothetical protein